VQRQEPKVLKGHKGSQEPKELKVHRQGVKEI